METWSTYFYIIQSKECIKCLFRENNRKPISSYLEDISPTQNLVTRGPPFCHPSGIPCQAAASSSSQMKIGAGVPQTWYDLADLNRQSLRGNPGSVSLRAC